MVKRILRRTLILCMILFMVLVSMPMEDIGVYAASVSGINVPGLTASYDTGTWSGSGTSVTGSVKTSSSSGCGGNVSYTPQTGILTLTNTNAEATMLSFDYAATLNGGSLSIDDQACSSTGSFTKLIASNGSVSVKISSSETAANETKINITNISLENKAIETTFAAPVNGSYTVDGVAVTADVVKSQESTIPYRVVATPANGYKFVGWYDVNADIYLSMAASTNLYVTSNTTIKPVFVPADTAMWEVGGKIFFDLNDATAYASSSGTSQITLIGSGVLPAGDYTIPAGKTLLIPFDDARTLYTTSAGIVNSNVYPLTSYVPSQYIRLTMQSGANLTVRGSLSVSAKLNSFNNYYTAATTGKYGHISMNGGSNIEVANGGNLYCWGFISGQGEVTARSGASVYEPFQICDMRGGSALRNLNGNSQKVLPFAQYYINNIEAPFTIEYGATEYAVNTITISGSTSTPVVTFVGNTTSSLFRLESGSSFRRTFDPASDKTTYDIYGTASLNSIALKISISIITVNVNTADYVLPIMENTDLKVHSGTTTINQDICVLPGCEITVDNGATVKVANGKNVYLYDLAEWAGKGYLFPSTDTANFPDCLPRQYSPTRTAPYNKSQMADARVDLNGTIDATGKFYTTAGGADITSTLGTGKFVLTAAPTASATTYQATQNGSDISYSSISATSARLHNDEAKNPSLPYTTTAGSAAGTTFTYSLQQGKWGNFTQYTVTLKNDDGTTLDTLTVTEGDTISEDAVEAPQKEGYVFEGWFNGNDQLIFGETPITGNITYTARYRENTYTYNEPTYVWADDNSTCTASAVCVEDPAQNKTETVNTTSAVTTEPTCENAGVRTYTATFTDETFAAQTKTVEIPKLGHELVATAAKDATCTEAGNTAYWTCSRCGKHFSDADGNNEITEGSWIIPSPGHSWNDGDITKDPTCTETGIKTFTCTVCGETRTEAIPALGHDLSKTEAKNATCIEAGNIEYWTCNRCGKLFSDAEGTTEIVLADTVINALGHAWDEGVVTTEPTCTETGVKTFTCTRCGETRTETVLALGHDLTKTEAKNATCTEAGNIEYWTCQRCGKIFSDAAGTTEIALTDTVIQATGHNYGDPTYEWAEDNSTVTAKRICANDPSHVDSETVNTTSEVTKPATCEEKGETTYTAAFTNSVFATQTKTVDNIEALGHDWQFTGLTWEGSDVNGYSATAGYKCKNNEEHTRSVAAAMTIETKDATCTTPGTVTYVATISESAALDGVERTDSKVVTGQALGHDYQLTSWNWADDLSSATATFTCTRDANHVETVTAEMSANTTPATCEEAGSVVHIATVTFEGKEYTNSRSEEIAALGHAWDEGVVTTEPTCTETGVKTFTCTRCGETRTETIEALGHNLTATPAVAATCTEPGNIAYWTCERCGKIFSDAEGTTEITLADTVVNALGHAWDEGVVTTEPTCTETGVKTFTCTRCGETRTETIEALGHDLTKTEAKAATCTEAGNIAYWTCERCGKLFSDAEGTTEITLADTVVNALGHAWDEGKVTTEPTCTTEGVKTFTCTRCGETRTETIEALGHNLTATPAVAATCTEPGNVEYWTCERCGKIFSDAEGTTEITLEDTVINALGHAWDEGKVTTEPTCTETGVKTFTCTRCGETRTETIEALGHNLTKTEAKAATCTEAGNIDYWTCERCGKIFSDAEGTTEITLADTVINALGHAWDEGKVTTEPTCTTEGVKTFTCTRCGETRTETIEALGHNLTKTECKEATCTEAGNIEYWTCERCGKIFSDAEGTIEIALADTVINALGHTWDEGVVTTEPTCTTEGVKTFTCTRCGETRNETIEALGHNLIKTEAKNATCTESGNIEYWTCERCGKIFSDAEGTTEITLADTVIAALGHAWDEGVVTTEPTCTTEGVKTFTCTRCGETRTETIEALGHDLTKTEAKAATCTEPGNIEYWTCERCGKIFSDAEGTTEITLEDTVINALGHAWDEGKVTTEPTCTETGVKTFTCTRCGETRTEAIEALGHDLTKTEAKASTCTEPGNIDYWTCERCGKIFSDAEGATEITLADTVINALGHAWDEGVVTTEPTCTETGVKTFICTRCGETRTETVPALGHDLIKTEAKNATCTEPGNIEYWTCERCGKIFSDAEATTEITIEDTVINALGHAWDEGVVTTEPTCTETGVKTFTCTRCGETRTETIEALGHDLTATPAVAATCTEPGNIAYWTCERCGKIFSDAEGTTEITLADTVIHATGHDYGTPVYTWSEDNSTVAAVAICRNNPGHIVTEEVSTTYEDVVAATCEGAGSRVFTATLTKEQFSTQTRTVATDPIGHDYDKPTYVWSDDRSTVTATAICKNDQTHILTETVNTTKDTTPATCEEDGKTVYTAEFENVLFETQTETVIIAATGHDYGIPSYEWAEDYSTVTARAVCKNDKTHILTETADTTKDTTPATCETAGQVTYTAEFTNALFETQTTTVTTPAIGHLYGEPTYEWSADKSTCTATAVCSNDPSHILTETATATSVTTTEATCETEGLRTFTATYENDKFATQTATEVIPAKGHTLVATAAVEPTCTEAGNSAYWTCSVCGKYFSDAEGAHAIAEGSWVLPAKGHSLIKTDAHPATCTEPGNSAYWTCSVCGEHFSDELATAIIAEGSWIIPVAGHIWDNGVVTTAATCTSEGEKLFTCTVCGATRTEVIAKLPHTIREVAAVASTCTLPGNSTYYVCDSCGHFFSDAEGTTEIAEGSWIIPANGHTWGEWVVIEAPDCVNEGSEQRTCTVCGATESQNLDPNGHTWADEYTIDQEPDCTTDGSKSRHCLFCNQRTDVEVIPALGHDWDTENVVFNWSEDLSSAEAVFTCKRDHSHVETLQAAVTSETAAGIITYTASVVFENATYTDTKTANAHEVIRISGKNRYETCIKIADYFIERSGSDKLPAVVLATGKDFPDALTGAYLANVNNAPIMLIDASSSARITTYIKNHLAADGTVYVLGGKGAVDDSWLADLSGYTVKRMNGKNRFETNLSILEESGAKGGDIFVCTGSNYADSLSASGIRMPILIVGGTLSDEQKQYLEGGSWNFHLVGGTSVVTESVENELKAYGTIADRTYGKDRYLTSKAMAERFIGETHEAVLAYGANFPDGLCGGPLACTMGAPIILSGSTPVTNAAGIQYTTGMNITSGLVVGGSALIDDQTVRTTFSMRESDEIMIYEQ